MTTYNTGNQVGSTSPKDLYDNAENFDRFSSGTDSSYADRLGVKRKSIYGMEQDFSSAQDDKESRFQVFLIRSGYDLIGEYAPGINITGYNQLVIKDGEMYGLSAAVSLPYVTTGNWSAESGYFIARGDAALRQDLSGPMGSTMVAYTPSGEVGVLRGIRDRLDDYLTAPGFGAIGDGVTNDTAVFNLIAANYQRRIIDLAGRTYLVDAYPAILTYQNPAGVTYINGSFKIGGAVYDVEMGGAVMASPNDTGGLQSGNSDGTYVKPSVSGRSCAMTFVNIASGNSRAYGLGGAANLASIYCEAKGNRSANVASRLGRAFGPQSANIASEEGQALGPKCVNIGSIYGWLEAEHNANIVSRRGYASGSFNFNLGSVGSCAGGGQGARFTPVVVGGVITAINIDSPGIGYPGSGTMVIWDRDPLGAGSGALATFTVSSEGAVTSVTVVNGGANYSNTFSVYILGTGKYCGNISSLDGYAYGEWTTNISSAQSVARYARSTNISTLQCTTAAEHASNIASQNSTAAGAFSFNLSSSSGSATGASSFTMAASYCTASADYAGVMGRRTANPTARSLAFGNASSGTAALTSNRKIHMLFDSGNINISGVLTQSQTFTDIAKMFENLGSEIPVGALVAWEGRKVRLAVEGDQQFSAHSRTYVQLLGDTDAAWNGRYVTDKFGRKIPKKVWDDHAEWVPSPEEDESGAGVWVGAWVDDFEENPEYDPLTIQVPRSQRVEEWTPVALLGEVHVRVDSTVVADDYVGPSDTPGVGTVSAGKTSLRCMEVRHLYSDEDGYAVALCLVF